MRHKEWIYCPVCRNKTRIKIREDTIVRNLPLFCPKCKQETLINIIKSKLFVITEPDA
ncbi:MULTISPECIES: cysteine-rich KTR domain-containing protein [Oscillospiraceae]|uniref:cysteine-rich KTR domain-containing protein n=1 Tax=Oscillospiraceae TaxID=216572 RepID=UPI000B3A597E|nr:MULTISPECIES: cysteine-rich KTR domain-containing protein [Oscillospiraceae]OUQ45065.1 conjugal transfer protein [Drancourtella sp. An12]